MMTVLIDGYSPEELLALPENDLDQLIFRNEPVVFSAGTATVLGKFWKTPETLFIELAHIDGGGEGVLPTIHALALRYAQFHGVRSIEWRVHAVHCAQPNPKLRRLLERRGFVVRSFDGLGEYYWLNMAVAA